MNKVKLRERIAKFRKMRKSSKTGNLIVVKRSNKVGQALNLPKVLNLNPRRIYNKAGEFVTFVEEEQVDLICMSESWEREELTLDELIKIDDFSVISNVHQRKGKGGRPAIIANTKKFHVENLTQSTVSIPWGVEVVWAILTPKNVSNVSKIQKIVVDVMVFLFSPKIYGYNICIKLTKFGSSGAVGVVVCVGCGTLI